MHRSLKDVVYRTGTTFDALQSTAHPRVGVEKMATFASGRAGPAGSNGSEVRSAPTRLRPLRYGQRAGGGKMHVGHAREIYERISVRLLG